MKAKNLKTGEIVTHFGISKEYGTISYIDSKGVLQFDNHSAEWQIIEEGNSKKEEIRAKIATEIYIHGLFNADGSISEVNAVDAVKHADLLLKELYKNK